MGYKINKDVHNFDPQNTQETHLLDRNFFDEM